MKKKDSQFKMLAVLTGVCLISAALLGFIHMKTSRRIMFNREKMIKDAILTVLPGTGDYKKISTEPVIFEGYNASGVTGYAVLSKGMGFQGSLVLMVGVETGMDRILGVAVLESVETPGLGDKIKAESFLSQFKGISLPEDGTVEVDTITGATISSKAVEKIINRAIEDAKRIS